MNPSIIQNMRGYYEQLYDFKLECLGEMDRFLVMLSPEVE